MNGEFAASRLQTSLNFYLGFTQTCPSGDAASKSVTDKF